MPMSTREGMRRELKELAKLAETMGKPLADAQATEFGASVEFPAETMLERPVTPASSSRVSVPPIASTMPPVFDYPPSGKGTRKRTGLVAVLVGAGLAIALVGGAAVGKSLAGNSSPTTPPVDVRGVAATLTAPPAIAPEQPVAPQAAAAPAVAPVAPTPVATAPAKAGPAAVAPAVAAAPVVHKHAAPRPAPAPVAPAAGAVAATPKASVNTPAAPNPDAVAAPKASPGLAKPAPAKAAAGGGGDSLEDLIRKEVAAQKK